MPSALVPEKREERTTEGGLDVASDQNRLTDYITLLREAGCRVSMFISHDPARSRPAPGLALRWWSCTPPTWTFWPMGIRHLRNANCPHCRPGQNWRPVWVWRFMRSRADLRQCGAHRGDPGMVELNIGHFLVGEAIFRGLEASIEEMRRRMDLARGLVP